MENNRVEKDGIIEVKSVEVLEAINRAEVDIQIATAKKYPRDINEALNKIATYAKMDKETAEDCFYVLRRRGANGQENVIEGLSVRMAEIIAGAWGNIRVQTRITGNDGKMITAQAICHDLETNFAVSKEVNRRITDKFGRTYSEDMQVVTGNAASSIAFRNAVLAVIPKAITKKVINEVKQVALGQSIDLEQSRQNIIIYFKKIGVSEEQILSYLDINSINEIDQAKVFELRATANAIKEGTTTVQETFVKPFEDAKAEAKAKEQQNKASDKASEAMAKAANGNLFENENKTTNNKK
jgi:phosphoribosylformylglycinamidine (FGAM) synthase PurS component